MRLHTIIVSIAMMRAVAAAGGAPEDSFDFETLRFRAKTLATRPYIARASRVPKFLLDYTYDQYRDIRFDPAHTLWRPEQLPFQLQFFHSGWLYRTPVQINELNDGEASPIKFSSRLFDYGRNRRSGRIPEDMGFAGFRILHDLNKPGDELASFLGASYFRVLCEQAHYGLSARGLALNTADPGGEEFPSFEEFWIERPQPGAKRLRVYALLDGPSVTGAYQFNFVPGPATVVHVRAVIFCRQSATTLGMAPLTSMFWHGENSLPQAADFRPEVHDSDGLLIENGRGEWIWRPVTNPSRARVTSFLDDNPRGFGLLQRDRQFSHYEDLEAYYHLRPSVWVEPLGPWGSGAVRLVELPTVNEFNDNIVAFWRPDQLPPPGEPIVFEYRLHWMIETGQRPAHGFTSMTKIAEVQNEPGSKRFVLEFDGPYLNRQPDDPAVKAVVTVGDGAILRHTVVQKNRFTGAWRVMFTIAPDGSGREVELRCFLRKHEHALTETWSYLWSP
ncbi:MAG: glucan biosynthesis protein G [Opitutaceae bacterium]|nr:glucan biosynthesis protein G [Opitutaceae bacterium]